MRNCLPDSSWQWGWTPKRQRVGHLSTSWLKCDLLCKKKIKTKTKHWLRNKEKGEKQLRSSGLGYSPVKGHSSILALTEPMYDYCYKLQEHQQEIKKKKKKSLFTHLVTLRRTNGVSLRSQHRHKTHATLSGCLRWSSRWRCIASQGMFPGTRGAMY